MNFIPYYTAFCEEILKKGAAFNSIQQWRLLLHRAEGRGREEEGREESHLWVRTVQVDQRFQEIIVIEG
jgi:hypothetical protein